MAPLLDVKTSPTPANWIIFFDTGAATIPVPLGAGTSLTLTDPHFPVTLHGTVCAFPILLPHHPSLTGTNAYLAAAIAPRMAN